jgi:hypothetical protein
LKVRVNRSKVRLTPSGVKYGSVNDRLIVRFSLLVFTSSASAMPEPRKFCWLIEPDKMIFSALDTPTRSVIAPVACSLSTTLTGRPGPGESGTGEVSMRTSVK